MRSLFVMDPLDRINVRGDSTYVTMRECRDRGWPVWLCTPEKLTVLDGVARAHATAVHVTREAPYFHPTHEETIPLGEFDVVWMRKDPPFDMSYVFATYVLDFAPPSTLVVNDPKGLKLYNEKLFAMRYPEYHPASLLARAAPEIRAFVEASDGCVVLKPWDGNGGRGVVVTDKHDRNLGALIELLTANGTMHLIAQRYVPGIVRGDKRILLFDGEPVGAILRVPSAKDHRGNMHVGATVEPTEITARERELCAILGADLKREGMIFVGIDVIDGHLTEVNVTSPTGLQEANRLYGAKLEADLVDLVAAKAAERRQGR